MDVYQVLVRNLDGRTRCLRFSSREIFCEDLKAELAVSEGIPGAWQRLVSGTRELVAGSSLVADVNGFFPSCTLLLRLRGGKGGFGSLLRGAATKAGQKKTSNFDACRDMSGRRLRHVNAEKKLKEWKSEAKERDLEKTAEDYLKKRRKVEEEKSGVAVDLEKFRIESIEAREEMALAVTDGLVESRRRTLDMKRKKVEAVDVDPKRPRLRLLGDADLEDSEDEEDSDGEDEAGSSGSDKGEASSSHSEKMGASETSTSGSSETQEGRTSGASEVQEGSTSGASEAQEEEAHPSGSSGFESPEKEEASQSSDSRDAIVEKESHSCGDFSKAVETLNPEVKIPSGPLNLDEYKSAKDLEVLGLDRLKEELQKVGLKCGGNLQERAARLWLLKTVPLEKLDKKLFSKPPRK